MVEGRYGFFLGLGVGIEVVVGGVGVYIYMRELAVGEWVVKGGGREDGGV